MQKMRWLCCQRINQLIYAGPSAKHEGHEFKWKTQGALTHKTDRENEVSKMVVESLGNGIELESTPRSQAVRTLK